MKVCNVIHCAMALFAIAFASPAVAMEYGEMHAHVSNTTKVMICHNANEAGQDEASMGGITQIFYSTQKPGFRQCPNHKNMGGKIMMKCMCGGLRSCNPLRDKDGFSIGVGTAHGEVALPFDMALFGDSSFATIFPQILTSNILTPEPHPPRFL